MAEILHGKTKLSISNAPIKKKETSQEKLGLLTKNTRKLQSFRLRIEVIEALRELTKKVNKKSNIKISMGGVLELLILNAHHKNATEILDMAKDIN
jgi:hypothetical protein